MTTDSRRAKDRGRQPRPATLAGDAPAADASTSPRPGDTEQGLDEMLRETFPASDAPQLDGHALQGAPANALPRHPAEHAPPPEVQLSPADDAAAFERARQTYPLGAANVTLSTSGGEVEIELPANRLTLDAAGLEQLIAALERHRPSLNAR
jgi:hypothetical protein